MKQHCIFVLSAIMSLPLTASFAQEGLPAWPEAEPEETLDATEHSVPENLALDTPTPSRESCEQFFDEQNLEEELRDAFLEDCESTPSGYGL